MRRSVARLILFCITGFSWLSSSAQEYGKAIDGSLSIGQAVRNYPDFPELNAPAVVGQFRYSMKLAGSRPWHKNYRYPWLGFQFTGATLGNNSVLGYMAGLTSDLRFNCRLGNNLAFSPILSIGAAWFSNPYDEVNNPENFIIGSSITFLAAAAGELNYTLKDRSQVFMHVTLLHASNAHYQLPNVGLNMPVAGIGFRRFLGEEATYATSSTDTARFNSKPLNVVVRLALGMNEQGDSQGPVNGPKYPIYIGGIYLTKKVSTVNKLKAGFEGWYNSGVYDYIVTQEFYEEKEKQRSCAFALMLGHEFLLGHFGVVTDVGLYLYNEFYQDKFDTVEDQSFKEEIKGYIPARIGFQYYAKDATLTLKNNFFAGIYIKSNVGQADFLETSVGYSF